MKNKLITSEYSGSHALDPEFQHRRDLFRKIVSDAGVGKCIIVTSSFRSGSSVISRLIGRHGAPTISHEKFSRMRFYRKIGDEVGFEETLQKVFSTTKNGLFSCKIMWPHRNALAASLGFNRLQSREFACLFPNAKWVNIVRQDKFAQAISFWRAKSSGVWHNFGQRSSLVSLDYNFHEILKCYHEQCAYDSLWNDFHSLASTLPINIYYEDFFQNFQKNSKALLEALDDYLDRDEFKLSLQSKRMSDEFSDSIKKRFLEDFYTAATSVRLRQETV